MSTTPVVTDGSAFSIDFDPSGETPEFSDSIWLILWVDDDDDGVFDDGEKWSWTKTGEGNEVLGDSWFGATGPEQSSCGFWYRTFSLIPFNPSLTYGWWVSGTYDQPERLTLLEGAVIENQAAFSP